MIIKDGYKVGLIVYRGDLDVSFIIVYDGFYIFNFFSEKLIKFFW